MRLLVVLILVLSSAVVAGKAAQNPDSIALDNDYVSVMHNYAACTSARTSHYGTRAIVALSQCIIESGRGTLTLQRGDVAVFLIDESYKTPRGEYFEVAFKLGHPPLKSPEKWIEPLKNTFVYSDEQFRVFQERLEPGDERELHSHAQRIVVRLNAARLTDPRFHEAGSTKGSIQVPNTVKFAEPIVHVVRNVSEVPLFNIVLEFKVPH